VKNHLRQIFLFALIGLGVVGLHTSVVAQQISIVSVTANGFGQTEAEALTNAVINGVAQVNGESIAASMRIKSSTTSNDSGTTSERSIEKEIARRTQGVVKSWRKISVDTANGGGMSATASVSVVVLNRSDQLKRLKLAIVPSRSGDPKFTASVSEEVTQQLTTSRKFAIMDRQNNEAIADQMQRIAKGGGAIEDRVRLISEVAPDYLAVVSTEWLGKGSGKQSLVGRLEIIDYATRQVKFSEKKSFPLKAGDDASNARRVGMLAKGLSRAVIQTVYPPIVVGFEEGEITIAQGSDFFNKGDKLIVKRMGNALRDPHTGEFLSYEQTDIGRAEISYVDARIAKAKLTGQVNIDPKQVFQKKYQVGRTGESTDDFFAGLTQTNEGSETSGGKKKASKLFTTDDDDD
jgi:hypothetical protein